MRLLIEVTERHLSEPCPVTAAVFEELNKTGPLGEVDTNPENGKPRMHATLPQEAMDAILNHRNGIPCKPIKFWMTFE